MKLEEMSAEELVRSLMSFSWVAGSNDESDSGSRYKPELLSRLTRGDKAIKAMEKMEELLSTGAPLMWASGEYIEEASAWERKYMAIIEQYRREK